MTFCQDDMGHEPAELPEVEAYDPQAVKVVTVLADRLPEALALLNKLARKAARYGNPDIQVRVACARRVEERREECSNAGRTVKVKVELADIEVSGASPRVGSHRVVARVDHDPAGNVVVAGPDAVADLRFRSTAPDCEHCKVKRQRKDLFVVESLDTGEQVQVGRTCLVDYVGRATPEGLLQRFAFWAEVGAAMEDGSWGAKDGYREPTVSVVSLAITCVRLFGWLSKGEALAINNRARVDDTYVRSTAQLVSLALGRKPTPSKYGETTEGELWLQIAAARTEADHDRAEEIVAWARAEEPRGEYMYNLVTIMKRDMVTDGRHLGIAVSVVSAHARAVEAELRRTVERKAAEHSSYVGAVGERLKAVPVTLASSRVVGSNEWGTTTLVKFQDASGNTLTWFSSTGCELQPGEKALLTGTVKKHDEYQGNKQTVLTRCKVERSQ
jgi:hypothetical protein